MVAQFLLSSGMSALSGSGDVMIGTPSNGMTSGSIILKTGSPLEFGNGVGGDTLRSRITDDTTRVNTNPDLVVGCAAPP